MPATATYQSACADAAARRLRQVAERIERDLELGGITAIEDKLQEGVPDTIRLLVGAGLKARALHQSHGLSPSLA